MQKRPVENHFVFQGALPAAVPRSLAAPTTNERGPLLFYSALPNDPFISVFLIIENYKPSSRVLRPAAD